MAPQNKSSYGAIHVGEANDESHVNVEQRPKHTTLSPRLALSVLVACGAALLAGLFECHINRSLRIATNPQIHTQQPNNPPGRVNMQQTAGYTHAEVVDAEARCVEVPDHGSVTFFGGCPEREEECLSG